MEQKIHDLYTNIKSPFAFGGVDRLYLGLKKQGLKISKNKIRKVLQSNDVYTLHKPARKRFQRQPIMVSQPGLYMNADLLEFGDLSTKNKGYKYLLLFQDMFSRYVYAELLKNKDAKSVSLAAEKILKITPHNYSYLQTDNGGEFYSKQFKSLMKKHNINHYSTFNRETKASYIERAIKTIKHVLYKSMTYRNKIEFLDELNHIIESYNKRPHSGLAYKSPIQVHNMTDQRQIQLMAKTILDIKLKRFTKNKVKFTSRDKKTINKGRPLKTNSYVRLVKSNVTQNPFQKGYQQQQTHEIFRIKTVNWDTLPYTYKLEDLSSEEVSGSFYKQELITTTKPEFFLIDHIIKSKIKNKKKYYYVAWKGYNNTFNSWVDSSAMFSLNKKK